MSSRPAAAAHILHVHGGPPEGSSFERSLTVARGLGTGFVHSLVLCGGHSSPSAPEPFRLVADFPRIGGLPLLGRLQRIARAMLRYDLVCTYEYGAMNAVMAHTAFSRAFPVPPLVHHESEHAIRNRRADWYRRIALGKAAGLVVPDERIEEAALDAWQQPIGRVKDIPLGIELTPWRSPPPADLLPRLLKRPGEKWVGLLADDMAPDAANGFIEAFAPLTGNWHLVAFSTGEVAKALRRHAERLEIAHRVHLQGALSDQGREIGLLDIAVFGDRGSVPAVQAVRALAAGVPIVADVRSVAAPLLPGEASEFVVDLDEEDQFSFALGTLAADHGLREVRGTANRAQARARHDAKSMIAAHRRLYASAIGQKQQ